MRISTQQLLRFDRWLVGLHRWIVRFPTDVSPDVDHGQFLVIKLAGMGSIIRFLSQCEEHRIDRSAFTLVTFSRHREVCDWMGVENCQYIRSDSLWHFLRDCWAVRACVRQRRPAWIIDLERCSNAVSLFRHWLAQAGGCRTLSFGTLERPSTSFHEYHDANLFSFHQIINRALEILPLQDSGYSSPQPVERDPQKVIVNINSSDYVLARRYPIHLFQALITELHQSRPGLTFYFTGSPQEANYVNQLVQSLTTMHIAAHGVAGEWTIQDLAAELSTASLFITGDSGPLHLAVHLHTPTMAIWGPTQPGQFGYEKKEAMINVTLSLSCSPCFHHPQSRVAAFCAGRISCLADLQPSSIVRHALLLMGFSPAHAAETS